MSRLYLLVVYLAGVAERASSFAVPNVRTNVNNIGGGVNNNGGVNKKYSREVSSRAMGLDEIFKFRGDGVKKEAKETFGFLDMIFGPGRADLYQADLPEPLKDGANRLVGSTLHLTKASRVEILEALKFAYRVFVAEAGGDAEKLLDSAVSVATILGRSELDKDAIIGALLYQASEISSEDIDARWGLGVGHILNDYRKILMVESYVQTESAVGAFGYMKRCYGVEGDNMKDMVLSVANDWRAVALHGKCYLE